MKTLIYLLIISMMLVQSKGQTNAVANATAQNEFPPAVFANGIGDKWYSASELEQIAKDYAKQKKIDFDFTKATERSVWIYTGGSNIIASVSFSSDFGKPAYIADIGRDGKVVTNRVGIAICGTK
jgi:hypothetical protein